MKIFRTIWVTLFAVIMCANLYSCSSEDPTEEYVTNGKKLVEMVWEDGGSDSDVVYKFSYHNDGKLSQVTCEFNNGISNIKENYYYNWVDNQIKISADGFNYICSLSDGLITEIKDTDDSFGRTYTFTYNQSKELINYKSVVNKPVNNNGIKTDCTGIWDNGNMTEFTDVTDSDDLFIISYSDIKNKGWWYPTCDYIGMDYYMERAAYLFLANPDLLGKPCANLPKKAGNKDYIFDIDKDGYVEMCKIVRGNGSTEIYTYEWE